MRADQRITINEVVNEVGISYGSAQATLTEELQMRWDETDWSCITTMPKSHGYVVQQLTAGKQITLMPQPPYLPVLTHCDFWLFPRLKMGLLGQCLWHSKTPNAKRQPACATRQRRFSRVLQSMAKLLEQVSALQVLKFYSWSLGTSYECDEHCHIKRNKKGPVQHMVI